MSTKVLDTAVLDDDASTEDVIAEVRHEEALLKTGALQNAILHIANSSIIATDEKGVIQLFNVGAERMLGYTAADVINQDHPGGHFRSAGSHRARQSIEYRVRNHDYAGLRGIGLQSRRTILESNQTNHHPLKGASSVSSNNATKGLP